MAVVTSQMKLAVVYQPHRCDIPEEVVQSYIEFAPENRMDIQGQVKAAHNVFTEFQALHLDACNCKHISFSDFLVLHADICIFQRNQENCFYFLHGFLCGGFYLDPPTMAL